jgi:hypothetical protein
MAKDFLNRHPKLIFLLLGLFLIVPAVWGTSKMYDKVIEEKQLRIEELSSKLIVRETEINKLTEYNKKLSKKVKIVKIVQPDGTIKEVTESDTRSETQISEQVQEKYKETIKEEISKIREEFSKVSSEKKKLTIIGGATLNMEKYIQASYNVWGPWRIGASIIFPNMNYLLGVGIDL